MVLSEKRKEIILYYIQARKKESDLGGIYNNS